MFKGYNIRQQHGFPNLNFFGDKTAYGQGGCNFWLKSDFGLNTQTNLGAVNRWVDSISGISFIQSTAGSQPRLLTSSVSYNNLPVIEFQDGSRFMSCEFGTTPSFRSIVFIANYDTINTLNCLISISDATGNIELGGTAANVNGVSYRSPIGSRFSGTTENTSVKIGIISDNMIMVNGVIENSQTFTIQNTFTQLSNGNGSNTLRGKISEIIGFTQPLNSDQATAISNQLNAKYLIY